MASQPASLRTSLETRDGFIFTLTSNDAKAPADVRRSHKCLIHVSTTRELHLCEETVKRHAQGMQINEHQMDFHLTALLVIRQFNRHSDFTGVGTLY